MDEVRGLTVLYDAACPICRTAHDWLVDQPKLVPLEFVPAGSAEAQRRFPDLDPAATLRDVTVVADTGAVYLGDAAWLVVLWALAEHRPTAVRLASPMMRPLARGIVAAAAAVRRGTRTDDATVASCDCEPGP